MRHSSMSSSIAAGTRSISEWERHSPASGFRARSGIGRPPRCRAGKDAETYATDVVREQELVQRYRSHRKFSKMHEHEARLERLQAERVDAPKATKKLRLPAGALA